MRMCTRGLTGFPCSFTAAGTSFGFGALDYLSSQYYTKNTFHADLPLETECFAWLRELKEQLGHREPRDQASADGLIPEHYQGSIIEYRGQLLLATRRDEPGGAEIHISELTTDLQVRATWQVHCAHPLAEFGQQDPRLFLYRGQLHVSFHGLARDSSGAVRVTVLLARLSEDARHAEDIWPPYYDQSRNWEKNWAFFEPADGNLCCVYSIEPHVVLRVEGEHAYEVGRTEAGLCWEDASLRGGAPPVRVGDEYYHWFHGFYTTPFVRYALGVYTFSAQAPFRVTRFARRPLLEPTVRPSEKPVVFPCGAILRDGRWLVSHGHNDRACMITRFDFETVERALEPVRPEIEEPLPPSWCIWLRRTAKRLETTRPHLLQHGLQTRFWEGFDGRVLDVVSGHIDANGKRLAAAKTALWLSHHALWRHCLLEPGNVFLLLEDDVVLVKDFARRLRNLLRDLPTGWKLCYAGTIDYGPAIMSRKLGQPVAPGLYRPHHPYGNHCYLVTRSGLQILLEKLPHVRTALDIQINMDALPHMQWYAAWPTLAHQRSQNGEWPSLP